ncbi:MAG: iron-sulfur cluster assembly accessory protein [Elusimicrobia bacterium]|nr:iron-sulfur cluster assembly accessory protein [Elusimicrobiota bacterium]MBI4218411.1 iron-sulfur cluster assembly accessory protein [Elusimicrobiota bacterium]
METTQTQAPVVTLTPATIAKVKEFQSKDSQAAGKAMRVFLEAGGCSGFQYGFTFDAKKEGDHEMTVDGVTVLIDPQSAVQLKGSVIDYKEDIGGEGFSIQNPNVKKSCGCGHSVEI